MPIYSQTQKFQFDQDGILNTFVAPKSVTFPLGLEVWDPTPEEPSYLPNPGNNSTGSSLSTFNINNTNAEFTNSNLVSGPGNTALAIALGTGIPVGLYTGVLTFLLLRKGKSVSLPPLVGSTNNPISNLTANSTYNQPGFGFKFGEELTFCFVIKDTIATPIYSDSIMYIKLPSWLNYSPESTLINNIKFTDIKDIDSVTYFEEESLLLIDIGSLKNNQNLILTFSGKILTESVLENEPFCCIKFQSLRNNLDTKWFDMPINKTISDSIDINNIINK
ncbi:MAG: hypothetical protein AB1782_14750 [Cyanobacteriota bacterium]